jgi:hypothetical protein
MLKAREIVIVFIIIKWLFHFIVTILRELRFKDNPTQDNVKQCHE